MTRVTCLAALNRCVRAARTVQPRARCDEGQSSTCRHCCTAMKPATPTPTLSITADAASSMLWASSTRKRPPASAAVTRSAASNAALSKRLIAMSTSANACAARLCTTARSVRRVVYRSRKSPCRRTERMRSTVPKLCSTCSMP